MSADLDTKKKPGLLDPKANLRALTRIVIIVAVLVGGVWLWIRFTAGEKAANRTTAAMLRRPIELKNSIENVSASSWKGFGFSLPYAGTLTIEAAVMKGNEVDVYVVQPDQIENVKNKKQFTHFQGFEARKTRNYRRDGRLAAGDYYLVIIDTSLGVLSAASSDVQIHAKLQP